MLRERQGLYRIIPVDFTYNESTLLSEKIKSEKWFSPAYPTITSNSLYNLSFLQIP